MPCETTYASHPTTITQLIQCTLWRVGVLENPEEDQRDDLHGHHANEVAAKAGVVAHGRTGDDRAADRFAAACLAERRLMNNRAAPGLPAGSCRKKESVVYTYVPLPTGATSTAASFGGSLASFIENRG